LFATALAILPARAQALQNIFIPYVGAGLEYDTNVFDLPGKTEARGLNGTSQLGDVIARAVAGVALNYEFGRGQRLRATVEGRQATYLHFDRLNHSEYLLGAGFDWRVSDTFDGSVDARAERRMVPFTERGTSDLTLERERNASARAGMLVTPEWRLEGAASSRVLDTPLPEAPEFELRESAARASVSYLGVDKLAVGFLAEVIEGSYRRVANARDFQQQTGAIVARYTISGLSRASAEVGLTHRDDPLGPRDGISALTGEIGFSRTISGKTEVAAKAFRHVRSDLRGAGFVAESGFKLDGVWKVTAKTTGTLAYEWVRSDYQYAGPETGGTRNDTRQAIELQFTWQALPWLAVRAHTAYQRRDADSAALRFDGERIGIEFLVKPET
jgi:hypothetical protein